MSPEAPLFPCRDGVRWSLELKKIRLRLVQRDEDVPTLEVEVGVMSSSMYRAPASRGRCMARGQA
jgi:hypothetical protein